MGIKVEVYSGEEDGVLGMGVNIIDKRANLADLLAAWQPLCDDTDIFRPYGNNANASCKGCLINCCNTAYVIPDIIAFKEISAYLGLGYREFIQNYFQKDKVEHGLLRLQPDPCIFLKNNICTIYARRTLLCRFYLCSQLLPSTEELIYSLTWTGAAAMQLFAWKEGLIKPILKKGLSSFDLLFVNLLEEYRSDPKIRWFSEAAGYEDVPLQPFL